MSGPYYDEAYTENGDLRRPYTSLTGPVGWHPLRPSTAVADELRVRPFGDDTRILPIPIIIDDTEYRSILEAGLMQRAGALQQLFADLVCGPQSVLDGGTGLTRDLLDDMLAGQGTSLACLRHLWQAHGPAAISFVYGPDLVRDPTGRWVVLEDNVGCVGGSADSFFVIDRYRTATGRRCQPDCDRDPDLAIAVRRWMERLPTSATDDVLAVLGCDTGGADPWALRIQENDRRRTILDRIGIRLTDEGRLADRLRNAKPPSALVNFDVEVPGVDRRHQSPLCAAFSDHRVALFNAPGTGVLGNKALLPFIDDIIRFFTGQDPLLLTAPTELLINGILPADAHDWVVKTANGRQGTEVFILQGQPRERLKYVEDLLRGQESVTAMVAQRYVEPSRLSPAGRRGWDTYRVEIRPVSYVLGWQDVYVSRQAVGKAVSTFDSRRLNNLSQGACYVPVLREPCCANGAPPSSTAPTSS